MSPLIRLEKVSKSFGRVCALSEIDFQLHENEIVGLVGDNGAGKSTLVKILSGVYPHDTGDFVIGDKEVIPGAYSVAEARKYGIETVHQEKSLGEKQPLWRNFFMGRHITNRFGFIRVGKEKSETLKVLRDTLGLRGAGVSPNAEVSVLSGGERQGLAIGRAMYFDSDIIILDEPTTALAVSEVSKVLSFISQIKERGKSGIFVSHNIKDIYEVSDRFVFMDRGRTVLCRTKSEISLSELTEILVELSNGREE